MLKAAWGSGATVQPIIGVGSARLSSVIRLDVPPLDAVKQALETGETRRSWSLRAVAGELDRKLPRPVFEENLA